MYKIAEYYEPVNLQEAMAILSEKPQAKIVAGGTDIFLKMNHMPSASAVLVSLRKLDELTAIRQTEDQGLAIGAMVTFSKLRKNPLASESYPILKIAASSVAGPQIRNVATVGGNICNGAPSADSAPGLLALEAEIQLDSIQGTRVIPLEDFYLGPSSVDLQPGEILTYVKLKPVKNQSWGGHYIKFSMRRTMDISTLGCAVVCQFGDNSRIEQLRIALGTAAPTPIRCKKAEKLGEGKIITDDLLAQIGAMAAEEANPRSSWRASKEFRLQLVKELTKRALTQAQVNAGR